MRVPRAMASRIAASGNSLQSKTPNSKVVGSARLGLYPAACSPDGAGHDCPERLPLSEAMTKELFQRNGLSLDRLRVLVALHETGSLIKAARGDGTRAAQYVRQIAELERFFEFPLIRREGRRVALNAEGAELARLTADFFRGIDDALQRGRGRERTYRIGAGESLLQWIVIPGLARLARTFPHAAFRLSNLQNSQIVLALEDRTIDFGLLRRESLRKPLAGVKLGNIAHCLCVPRRLMRGLRSDDWRAILEKLPLAVHLESSSIQAELDAALDGLAIRPHVRLRCDTFPSAMSALNTGVFATLMIRFPGAGPLPQGVEIVPLPFLAHTDREICLAWNPRLLVMRPEAEHVRNALRACLAWQE